ncbi:MAG: AI-2E family transporter [Verrucomicrobiota bacterium]
MQFPPPSERQARIIWTSLTTLALALGLSLLGAVLWGLGIVVQHLSPVLWPFAVGVVLAYLLSPVVDWLEQRGLPRMRALVLVFAGSGLILLGAVGSLVPRAVVEARDLASQLPVLVVRLQHRVQTWLESPPASLRSLLPKEVLERLPQPEGSTVTNRVGLLPGASHETDGVSTNGTPALAAWIAKESGPGTEPPWWVKALDPNSLKSVGTWVAAVTPDILRWGLGQVGRLASFAGILAGLSLIPVYAFFLLLEERRIARTWTDYLPVADADFKREAIFVLRSINDALIVFFRGQVLVALCDGILYAIGFLLIGLPYALLIGLMACVVTIIPFLGAALTCGTALLIAVVQFGDWQHPALVVAVFCVVQFIEGFVLQPKIIGDRVGLHPVMIIIALMVGTTLMGGILGGILAIPLTAALRVLMAHYVWRVDPGNEAGSRSTEPAAPRD